MELDSTIKEVIGNRKSNKLLYDMLFDIARLKYVRQSQLPLVRSTYKFVCAKHKLSLLVEAGLLTNTYLDVFTATDQTLKLLKSQNYPVELLPKNIAGLGDINELNNTDVFISALKNPLFKALLYPRFPFDKPYLIPDALLILADKDKYKLIFLEVEASKSNWDNYIEDKRIKYIRLAKDKVAYNYWKSQCDVLKLKIPSLKDFKFSVMIIGKIKKDFGDGFNFVNSL